MIKFTAPDGKPVWIVGQWVTLVRATLSGEPGNTHIVIGGNAQNVNETLDEVVAMLKNERPPSF